MTVQVTDRFRFRRAFVLILVFVVSAMFFQMIRSFVLALLMGAIFTGLTYPLYERLLERLGGRKTAAAIGSLVLILVVLITPLIFFLGIVASQAAAISQSVSPWISEHLREPTELGKLLEGIPFMDRIEAYKEPIMEKTGELASVVSSFLVNSLSAATRGTVGFFFDLFIMLYAMFFFLTDGRELLDQVMRYVPLPQRDKTLMLDKFVSVSRATLKGTLIVGIVQGGLAGLAFAVAGIKGAAFWGTIMVVLSIIPGVGTAVVWVPAVIYLFAVGQVLPAVGLLLWCALVVGTVDNVLRPILVGKDTEMPDILVFLSTLGGLLMFGAAGLVIGPIIAALFVAVWRIYAETFGDALLEPRASEGEG